jgi:hypothetical protein
MTSRTPDIAVGTVIHGDTVASGTAISPDLFGAFFEDPSHAADGGLYAELIQNRSFAYSRADRLDWHALTAWEVLEREGAAGAVAVSAELRCTRPTRSTPSCTPRPPARPPRRRAAQRGLRRHPRPGRCTLRRQCLRQARQTARRSGWWR